MKKHWRMIIMKLKEFINNGNKSVAEIALFLEIHRTYLYAIMNEKREPSLHLAREIERMTHKMVTVDDLIKKKEPGLRCPCCGRKIYRNLKN